MLMWHGSPVTRHGVICHAPGHDIIPKVFFWAPTIKRVSHLTFLLQISISYSYKPKKWKRIGKNPVLYAIPYFLSSFRFPISCSCPLLGTRYMELVQGQRVVPKPMTWYGGLQVRLCAIHQACGACLGPFPFFFFFFFIPFYMENLVKNAKNVFFKLRLWEAFLY